jgi:RimJ/RimL family protein N-acetyltransferase
MKLYTKRLKLIPLTENDLKESLEDLKEFYKSENLISTNKRLSDLMHKIYQIKLVNIKNDPENYLFYTYWLIVKKETNQVIGRIGFKDSPNKNKTCEVGYGIKKSFQSKGYMTEALKKLIIWGFNQEINPINTIIAKTNEDNIPSQKVLKKVGFKKKSIENNLVTWIIKFEDLD